MLNASLFELFAKLNNFTHAKIFLVTVRKACMYRVQAFHVACRQSWGPFDGEKGVENTQNQPMYFTLQPSAPFGQ